MQWGNSMFSKKIDRLCPQLLFENIFVQKPLLQFTMIERGCTHNLRRRGFEIHRCLGNWVHRASLSSFNLKFENFKHTGFHKEFPIRRHLRILGAYKI